MQPLAQMPAPVAHWVRELAQTARPRNSTSSGGRMARSMPTLRSQRLACGGDGSETLTAAQEGR